jgi:hypothetical protein
MIGALLVIFPEEHKNSAAPGKLIPPYCIGAGGYRVNETF